jgi:hypothetical protein
MNAFDFYRSKNLISISLYPFAYRGGGTGTDAEGTGAPELKLFVVLCQVGCRLGLPLREARF